MVGTLFVFCQSVSLKRSLGHVEFNLGLVFGKVSASFNTDSEERKEKQNMHKGFSILLI